MPGSDHDTGNRPMSFLRRVVRRTAIITSTLATGALAVALVLGGTTMIADRAVSVEVEEAAPPVVVSTRPLVLEESFRVPRAFVGQVEALQRTEVAFERPGTVEAILVDEGAHVEKGAVLARLDTRTLENQKRVQRAARKALEAQAELARLTTQRQEALKERGFSPTQTYDEARLGLARIEAQIAEIDAAIAGIDILLDKSVIRAPFDARVGSRAVDIGASVGAAQSIITLLEDAAPQMRVGIAPSVADGLALGDRLSVEIDGQHYPATVSQLRPDLDPATRTRTVLLRIDAGAGDAALLYGQTGAVHLAETIAETGTWIPVAALQEGPRGLWTVLTLENPDSGGLAAVQLEAVEVLYATEDQAFVRGTFADDALLIDAGPHRVVPGQTVRLAQG